MKKRLRNISILIVLLLGGYFIYDYLQVDYIPEQKRSFYKRSRLEKNKPVYKRRQLLHEELPEYEETAPIELAIEGSAGDIQRIRELIKQLDKRNKECEAIIGRTLPNEEIIDPENPIFKNPELLTEKITGVFDQILHRDIAISSLKTFESYYQEKTEVESDLFFNSLRSTLICRGADIGLFLESAYEAMDEDRWTKNDIEVFNSKVLGLLASSLEYDTLPDNLLFSLNILRLVGKSGKLGDDYYSELDDVYGRISAYEDSFFDEIQDNQKIYSPGDKFQNYFEELDEIGDEIRYIMNRRFKDYRPVN